MRAPAAVTTERPAKVRWLIVGAIVLIAAALRFIGLAWGLRHAPVRDEQSFVENAGLMLELRDLNHRFHEYPGLFIDLLCPVLAVIPPSTPYTSPWDGLPRMTRFGPSGYLAARGLVAAFGVLSVVLVYRLGSHLVSPSAGLVPALLQAVSPVETFVAHEVRPDVVLEFFVLLALLSYQKVGERARQDVVAGLATGAAMAVKFTGLLIAPCYLLARWLSPGHRMRGTLVAGFTAAAVWFLSTPYALLSFPEFVKGAAFQVNWHYRGGGFAPHFWSSVAYYLRTILWSLGPLGAASASSRAVRPFPNRSTQTRAEPARSSSWSRS